MLQRGAPKLGKDGKPMKDKHGKVIYEPYRIKVLNTINFKKSMHYNPFAYIHSEKDILKLVTTLIANTKGEGKAGDDFWVKAETLLYCALIGYIHYEAPVEEQNFSISKDDLYDLLNLVLKAYLRKMALDGYVVKLELPELKELVSLMRRSSNNLNQLTRKVHETGRVYDADLEDISQRQEQLWEGVEEILTQLSKLL